MNPLCGGVSNITCNVFDSSVASCEVSRSSDFKLNFWQMHA